MADEQSTGAAGPDRESVELRLALVMNGGVSLAVWMGGVVHELNLLRLASQHLSPDKGVTPSEPAADDRPVFDFWLDLLRRNRKEVTVDIISGTSAGGLNGLLLATAIARGGSLPGLRDMWEKSADLKSLLSRDGTGRPPNSLFNGEFFKATIEEAIPRSEGARPPGNVTLFVTGTALDGPSRQFQDGFDQKFDVRDHRRVYRFGSTRRVIRYVCDRTRSPSTWELVTEDAVTEFRNDEPLVLAARLTASYPAAFRPVSEDLLVPYRVLPEKGFAQGASCVMDGGVLNNAPFGPVLDEIARRPIEDRPVDRVLVYVVPSAGTLADERAHQAACDEIGALTVALSALSYPQEADFRSSTEDLDQRLKGSVRSPGDDLFDRLLPRNDSGEGAAAALAGRLAEAAVHLADEYRRSRAKALVLQTLALPGDAEAATPIASPPQLTEEEIESVVHQPLNWLPPPNGGTPGPSGPAAALTSPDLDQWEWGITAAVRLLTTLGGHLNQSLVQAQRPTDTAARPYTPDVARTLQERAREINQCLLRAIAVRDEAEAVRQVRRAKETRLGVVEAAGLISTLYSDLRIREVLGQQVRRGAAAFLDALRLLGAGRWTRPEEVVSAFLAVEVVTTACAPATDVLEQPTPRFRFLRLGPDSTGRLFRQDWERSLNDRKLFGIRFRHFGAFINTDWRRSDFVWGRLDAAHHLLPLIAPDEGDLERELHELIMKADSPGTPDPVAAMTDRLARLRNSSDSMLLGRPEIDLLRTAGENAVAVLQSARQGLKRRQHWAWQRICGSVALLWSLACWFWRPRAGETGPRRSLGKALGCAAIVLTAVAVVALIALGVLVGALLL
ncbi:DUF3376 domain-containing protein [Kitasatospora sp. NPDC059571]|uniref:DUF3376 domain-containing protein n=1 Tax=Kitasatospora sp. NPDC059571 TaxID=3346871 RepID=UPI0036A10134